MQRGRSTTLPPSPCPQALRDEFASQAAAVKAAATAAGTATPAASTGAGDFVAVASMWDGGFYSHETHIHWVLRCFEASTMWLFVDFNGFRMI